MKDSQYSTLPLAYLAALLLSCSSVAAASADTITIPVSFGPGAGAYETSDNFADVIGNTDSVALSYFVGSGLGAASATYSGNLTIDYPSRVTVLQDGGKQRFDINLSWTGGTFAGSSSLTAGANAKVWVAGESASIFDKTATVNTTTGAKSTPPATTVQSSGTDSIVIDLVDLVIASVGGSFRLDQTVDWTLGPIKGIFDVRVGERGLGSRPFSIGSSGTTTSSFFEEFLGDWTFTLEELLFTVSLSSGVDVDLCATVGIAGFDFEFGCEAISAYGTPLTALPVFHDSTDVQFHVLVAPEPGTLVLLGAGLAGLIVARCRMWR